MTSGTTNRCSWLIPAVLLLLLTLDQPSLGMPSSPPIRDVSGSNESCGINMECVPRRLCQDDLIQDDGFFLISPMIGQTKCSNPLRRCCQVKQKEDNSQT